MTPKHKSGALWQELFPHWDFPLDLPEYLVPLVGWGPQSNAEYALAQAIDVLPKTELHVHVEAAVPQSFYDALGAAGSIEQTRSTLAQQGSFAAFIAAWLRNGRLLGDPRQLTDLAEAFVASRSRHNIVHTEAHLSLADLSVMRLRRPDLGPSLSVAECLRCFCRGLKNALARPEHHKLDVRIIVDVLWMTSRREKYTIVESLFELVDHEDTLSPRGDRLIVGVGLGGAELQDHMDDWCDVLSLCKQRGLLVDLHCGETASHAEALAACQKLRPHRISHGIAGAPNWIFRGPVAACPLSNMVTGRHTGTLATHPARSMCTELPLASINTDDPLLFGTNLVLEFIALARAWNWTIEDISRAQERAAASRWHTLV